MKLLDLREGSGRFALLIRGRVPGGAVVAHVYRFRSGRWGGKKIEDQLVGRALDLLARGVTAGDVMRQLRISERTMYRIVDGTHPAIARLKSQKKRCPTCGGKLLNPDKPCLLCTVRNQTKPGAA